MATKRTMFERTLDKGLAISNVAKAQTVYKPMVSAALGIDTAIESIRIFHDTTTKGQHTRYRSWTHCFKAFRDYRLDKNNINLLCLHVVFSYAHVPSIHA